MEIGAEIAFPKLITYPSTQTLWIMGIGTTVSLIYYLFGVPKVRDKLQLHYKQESEVVQRIIDGSNLKNSEFVTSFAGSISYCQMCCMVMIEKLYHALYTQVSFHREIFKFQDGGQCAMDWGFSMPQKTKYMSREFK